MNERVEVTSERAVELGRRRHHEAEHLGAVGAEVQLGSAHLEEACLPQPKVECRLRHVLGASDQPRRDRVQVVIDEVARLRGRIDQSHPVRLPVVEELSRRVVALLAQHRVETTADIAIQTPQELREVVRSRRDVAVVVADDRGEVVDRHAGVTLSVRQAVEADVAHAGIPRRQEGLATDRSTRDRRRRACDVDARRRHPGARCTRHAGRALV
ncbi:MAG: hypothetical protein H6719_08395 [Sandaracinaceae bacterium]|nr:hypothetical protein [Sandaracinaceae bacterium]